MAPCEKQMCGSSSTPLLWDITKSKPNSSDVFLVVWAVCSYHISQLSLRNLCLTHNFQPTYGTRVCSSLLYLICLPSQSFLLCTPDDSGLESNQIQRQQEQRARTKKRGNTTGMKVYGSWWKLHWGEEPEAHESGPSWSPSLSLEPGKEGLLQPLIFPKVRCSPRPHFLPLLLLHYNSHWSCCSLACPGS